MVSTTNIICCCCYGYTVMVVKTTDRTLFGVHKLPDVAIVMNASNRTHLPGVTQVCQDLVISGLAHMILLVGS